MDLYNYSSQMPLEGEDGDLFSTLAKTSTVTVIGHTHLCNALQKMYAEKKREAGTAPGIHDAALRASRFAYCKILVNPTELQMTQVTFHLVFAMFIKNLG